MKCLILVVKGESTKRALITIKAQKDKVDSHLEQAKKRVNELEAELKRVKEGSEKALEEARLMEEANVRAALNRLEIEQNIVHEIG